MTHGHNNFNICFLNSIFTFLMRKTIKIILNFLYMMKFNYFSKNKKEICCRCCRYTKSELFKRYSKCFWCMKIFTWCCRWSSCVLNDMKGNLSSWEFKNKEIALLLCPYGVNSIIKILEEYTSRCFAPFRKATQS